jgi:hypothetical protein
MTQFVMGLLIVSTAYAQEGVKKEGDLTDPVEILKKADAATKQIKAVQYKASAKATGFLATNLQSVEGSVTLSGWSGNAPEKFRYEGKFQKPGSSDVEGVAAGSDGKAFYLVDAAKKMAYEDIDPAVVGPRGRVIRALTMAEFVHPEAFGDEIKAEKSELKGTTKVGDHDCYEIHVKYSGGAGEAVWFFSKKDFLPRRVDRLATNPAGEKGTRELIVTELTVNPKLSDDSFKLVLPEGYTKTDEFAP